ncbi:MAG: hypothetical protein AMK69_22810 [Nitrospira bacterium SG8_3]|nr:MAG: hypothetical protein AMK69_22810 [Nitrospira bacterium SG8_3]
MIRFLARVRMFIFCAVLLLFLGNCTRVTRFVESADPYHTESYKRVCDQWSQEARIHHGFEVQLIVSATFESADFRQAYADEYAAAYQLTAEEKRRFVEDQMKASHLGHEFLLATFVPEKRWDDFDKVDSMWKLFLVNDEGQRVVPVEVRDVKEQNAVMSHFFPYITPWKSVYLVRFPCNMATSSRPIIGDDTKEIGLIITSVLGTAEIHWSLE